MDFLLTWFSRVCGRFFAWRPPAPLAPAWCRGVAWVFGADLRDAEGLHTFRSFQDVFTRRLVPGSRTFDAPFGAPVDGKLTLSASLMDARIVQAKGLDYAVADLIADQDAARRAAWSFTFFLAPSGYHRVHTPLPGFLQRACHVPGSVWPVNPPFDRLVPRLYVRNERLIFRIASAGGGVIHVVMVGGCNVGKMVAAAVPGLCAKRSISDHVFASDIALAPGAELGHFQLGSTVIVILDHAACRQLGPFLDSPGARYLKAGAAIS